MRGLNTKLQTMMTTCTNVTCHEAVNITIASEAKYRQHKELKKKKSMLSGSFGGNPKMQRVIYHPVNHNCPPQFQASQQLNARPATTYQNPQPTNASRVSAPTP